MATVAPAKVEQVLPDDENKIIVATLTEAVDIADDGGWFYLGHFSQGISIEFIGLGAGDTVQVFGTNLATTPADSDDHIQIGNDQVDAAGIDIVPIATAPLWIKTKISVSAGNAITTRLVARKP